MNLLIEPVLLCERIDIDEDSGRVSLIGLYTHLYATEFPAKIPLGSVYALVRGGDGEAGSVLIDIMRKDGKPIDPNGMVVGGDTPFDAYDPENGMDVTIPLPSLWVEEPGEFTLTLIRNGQAIGRREFTIMDGSISE